MNYRNLRKIVWIQCYKKHFPESKHVPESTNTSQNPQTLPRIQNTSQNPKHFPESKTTSRNPKRFPRIQNTSQNLDSGKCFWILGSVLDSGKCFWILGSVFVFWDVFWILVSVLSLRATVQCDCTSENYLENSELNCCTVKRIWDPDFTFGYWSSCFCPMLSSGHFAQNLVVLRYG